MAATVTLSPGANIQNAINSNPAGTSFLLNPGVYRTTLTMSKNGDSFIGQPGATMDGAGVLTGWTQASINGVLYWTKYAGTPVPAFACGVPDGCCVSGHSACIYPQNLYVDNVEYQHVTSLANVVAGTSWYYDHSGADGGILNNIYMAAGDMPNSHTVELGKAPYAFAGSASNITIKNLIIEKYAAPLNSGAVNVLGRNWLIQNNEVRLNHGEGIIAKSGGDNIHVLGNNVHHNGQMGIGGPGNSGLWDSNTIAFNNTDYVNPGFEAGGSKFNGNNVMISNNVAHDNYGPGLWTDVNATYNTYDHNTSYNNYNGGIRYEISRYGVITNNLVYGNTKSAEIVYTGSDHGRISGNTVIDNGWGAIGVWNIVGTRPNTQIYQVADTQVTNNTVQVPATVHQGVVAGLQDFASPHEPRIFGDPTNFFDYNTYQFEGASRSAWHWGETSNVYISINWSAWQAGGEDLHGRVSINTPVLH
jgi:parallel beta-helix repeat protein